MTSEVIDNYIEAFEHACARALREGWATIHRKEANRDHGPILTLVPIVEEASALTAHFESPWQIDLTLGASSPIELYDDRPGGAERISAELVDIVEAVTGGRISETVWSVGDEKVRSKGQILRPGRAPIRFGHRMLLAGFLRLAQKTTIHYAPYEPGANR